MPTHKSFARYLIFSENQSAFTAVQDLIQSFRCGKAQRLSGPLFLHGPPGTGKSHLVSALAREVSAGTCLSVQVLSASDFRVPAFERLEEKKLAANEAAPLSSSLAEEARQCDLLIVEDLHHLPLAATETLVQIIDFRHAHQCPMVFTAAMGPRHLAYRGIRFSARLTSRLAAGLVVALEPLKALSRQRYLEESAQRSQLALPRDIVHWLARNLNGGGRQLDGAIAQLETLSKVGRQPINLESVMAHFCGQLDATRPSVERIACRVGGYFQIDKRQLQSRRRYRNVLLPRQISMYLARQLTALSLDQIGFYFGGRDHSTVLHACRKVERAMQKDAVLSGTVRQIHAELA